MAEIQRHRPARGIDSIGIMHSYMIRDKFGSCVKYNDHIAAVAALTAERDALKEQVARLSKPVSDWWYQECRPIINAIGEISVQEAMDAIERDL